MKGVIPMKIENMIIKKQVEIAPNIYHLQLQGENVAEMSDPGQFVHLRIDDGINPTLRRPLSICDVDMKEKILHIVYRIEGRGTHILSEKKEGETVNVFGPLGTGFPLSSVQKTDRCLLIGGGIGIPPLYYLGKKLVQAGIEVVSILGFRKREEMFFVEEFAQLGKVFVTTEDGSFGTKGYVTDVLTNVAEYDIYFSCGPKPMLKAVEQCVASPGYISLEERLGCGIGACLACVCHLKVPNKMTGRKYGKICSDGPVFLAGEVVL